MKRLTIITALLAFATLSGLAQDKLVRVNKASAVVRKGDASLSFYDKELARLLIPTKARFGVLRKPSLMRESSLTYDSVAHVLVYMLAEESIWGATRQATIEWKDAGNNSVRESKREHPIKYKVPGVEVYTLPVTEEQAKQLRNIWNRAVRNAEKENEDMILDGTTWLFFINGKQAKTKDYDNTMAKFVDELMKVVRDADFEILEGLLSKQK